MAPVHVKSVITFVLNMQASSYILQCKRNRNLSNNKVGVMPKTGTREVPHWNFRWLPHYSE
jgi:hypothetical protein